MEKKNFVEETDVKIEEDIELVDKEKKIMI